MCCLFGRVKDSDQYYISPHEFIQQKRARRYAQQKHTYAHARACRQSRQNSCSSGTMRADTCGILLPACCPKLPQDGNPNRHKQGLEGMAKAVSFRNRTVYVVSRPIGASAAYSLIFQPAVEL